MKLLNLNRVTNDNPIQIQIQIQIQIKRMQIVDQLSAASFISREAVEFESGFE